MVLLGNKSDKVDKRAVSTAEGLQLARGFGNECPFFETSAKTGDNIIEAFTALIRQMKKCSAPTSRSPTKSKGKKKGGGNGNGMKCSLI